ncbi:Beta-glucosidase [Arcticibacter svalbardensis MN12-7]|uniref:Beta-glucosidase n=1 Tax=Arcticibacter svalbardensis MN12-7 TaxID=1150600 RepID=R9GWD6_9SPHI|nr:glycoside hydrolase family 3 C-terminal domain-containing protein [Arcticibacter svalbardensis]EOR96122.1 Beta-glucosidase [Arcticibacter svalbardensis MN12-7]
MRKSFLFILVFILFNTLLFGQKQTYKFQKTNLSFEERSVDLVSQLTLEEKVAQMMNTAPAIPRLGIPAYNWWNEVLHGVARTSYHVTVYPQAIAMAATFDPDALNRMADYSALEGRAIYNDAIASGKAGERYVGLTYWTPNINIFRDPRWGRGQETYGEDPYLTGTLGKSFVKGLQGDDPKYLKAAACAKHYAVHSGPESLRHVFDVSPSDYDLWDTYLPAFKELVVNASVAGVMCAYNAFKGQPCCGSDQLMMDILRNQWKFKGYVTSDCWAIDDFFKNHKTHPDAASASADAVFHGTDIDCGTSAYLALVDAVKQGIITESQIDVSVRRLFMIRFRLGMFDPVAMVQYAQTPKSVIESEDHQAHALKMAQESIVLLKNENNTLPLSKNIKKIAVLGPNADNSISILGNYNGTPSNIVTALKGIKEKVGNQVEVTYEAAINFTNDFEGEGKDSSGVGSNEKAHFAALVNRVKDADVIVFVGGISPQLEGEEMKVDYEGFNGGDRTSIQLPRVQTRLMKALQETGKPVVFVMMTGSAIAIPWEAEHIPAIVNAWYGGQSAGTAIANVLFGDYNPSGRLPVTFYKADADLPAFENYSMDNRTYRYFKGKALYPFGYGLSYTTFAYTWKQQPAKKEYKGKDKISCTIKISNTGLMDGSEVVQAYIEYPQTNTVLPLKELRQFDHVFINKAGSKELNIEIPVEALKKWSTEKKELRLVPGDYHLIIGSHSSDKKLSFAFKLIE